MEDAFKHFDKDGSGIITSEGFSTGLREMGVFEEFSLEEMNQVLRQVQQAGPVHVANNKARPYMLYIFAKHGTHCIYTTRSHRYHWGLAHVQWRPPCPGNAAFDECISEGYSLQFHEVAGHLVNLDALKRRVRDVFGVCQDPASKEVCRGGTGEDKVCPLLRYHGAGDRSHLEIVCSPWIIDDSQPS